MAENKLLGAYDEVEVEDTLLLKDFAPRTMLKQTGNIPDKAGFPAIDAHVHLDETGERDVSFYLKLMDEVGLEACVSIQQLWAEELPTLDITQEPRRALSLAKVDDVAIDALGLLHYEQLFKSAE